MSNCFPKLSLFNFIGSTANHRDTDKNVISTINTTPALNNSTNNLKKNETRVNLVNSSSFIDFVKNHLSRSKPILTYNNRLSSKISKYSQENSVPQAVLKPNKTNSNSFFPFLTSCFGRSKHIDRLNSEDRLNSQDHIIFQQAQELVNLHKVKHDVNVNKAAVYILQTHIDYRKQTIKQLDAKIVEKSNQIKQLGKVINNKPNEGQISNDERKRKRQELNKIVDTVLAQRSALYETSTRINKATEELKRLNEFLIQKREAAEKIDQVIKKIDNSLLLKKRAAMKLNAIIVRQNKEMAINEQTRTQNKEKLFPTLNRRLIVSENDLTTKSSKRLATRERSYIPRSEGNPQNFQKYWYDKSYNQLQNPVHSADNQLQNPVYLDRDSSGSSLEEDINESNVISVSSIRSNNDEPPRSEIDPNLKIISSDIEKTLHRGKADYKNILSLAPQPSHSESTD